MNKLSYFFILFCCVFTTSCSDFVTCDEDNILLNEIAKSRMVSLPQSSFSVTEAQVCKYIGITRPNKTIQEITPIVRNTNDTLAYIVQYTQGWDLISGDIRITPRLAFSETGTLNMADYALYGVGGIEGMIDLVGEIKQSNDTTVNAVWEFLSPQQATNNEYGISPYGDVAGMWVPVDTTYIDNPTNVPHIIQTRWHQESPYNSACPIYYAWKNGSYGSYEHYAGCGPVAVGQVIFHYLKNNNPYNISIPMTYTRNGEGSPVFSNFSASQWQNLSTSTNSIAVFLAFLGKDIMSADYHNSVENLSYNIYTGVDTADCRVALDWAHFQYCQDSMYDWQHIVSSLQNNRPIVAMAYDTTDPTDSTGHVFIIDALRIHDSKFVITYEWDDNYHPDYWELQRYPAWMFELSIPNNDGKDGNTYQEEIVLENNCSVAMNWGLTETSYNNVFYTLRSGTTTLSPVWRVGSFTYEVIEKIFYNISQ